MNVRNYTLHWLLMNRMQTIQSGRVFWNEMLTLLPASIVIICKLKFIKKTLPRLLQMFSFILWILATKYPFKDFLNLEQGKIHNTFTPYCTNASQSSSQLGVYVFYFYLILRYRVLYIYMSVFSCTVF